MSKIKLTLLASGLILSLGMQPTSKADEENKIYFPGSETDFLKSDDLSWDKIPQHYVPSKGIGDWQKLYTKRPKQWKEGYSAYELAHSWENAKPDLPPEIAALFYGSVELLAATPEHKTPLPGGRAASQSDVLAFIRIKDRVCAVAVEGKMDEEFGTQTVGQWFKNPSAGKIERLQYISKTLGLSYPPPDEIRYQLLHRTASAVIEAERFKADCAAMIVQSFSSERMWFEDYASFLDLFGIQSAKPGKLYKTDKPGITLYFGWATSPKQPVEVAGHTAVAKTTTPSKPAGTVAQISDTFTPLMQSIKIQPTVIIGAIVIFSVVFLVVFVRRNSRVADKKIEEGETISAPDVDTDQEDSGADLGIAFQNYVESLLGKRANVKLLKPSNEYDYPDFEMEIRDATCRIDLECKWRSSFYQGYYDVIKEQRTLQKYKKYQQKNKRPFFIVLGVEGTEEKPNYLYTIPLEKLPETKLNYEQLKDHLQKGTGYCNYNPTTNTLTIPR